MEPAVPEKVEVGLEADVTEPPVPDMMLQEPVPIVGVFAARVTVVKPQVAASVWSGPAFAADGFRLKVMVTSSVEAGHGGFAIVQRNV